MLLKFASFNAWMTHLHRRGAPSSGALVGLTRVAGRAPHDRPDLEHACSR